MLLPARGQRRVGDAGVLDVERRIVGEHVPRLDVGQVGQVVLGQVDRVVGQVVVPALDARGRA